MGKIDVVGLVVQKGRNTLVEKRRSDKKVAPGEVTVPGGHVEKEESLKEACKRELREELGIHCNSFEPITTKDYLLETENQKVHYFLCKGWEGNIKEKEAEEVFWISPTELHKLDYPKERRLLKKQYKNSKRNKN